MSETLVATCSRTVTFVKNGAAGRGIAKVEVAYAGSESATQIPGDDNWTADINSLLAVLPQGWYMWTRVTQTFTDSTTPVVSYSVSHNGTDDKVVSTEVKYLVSSTQSTQPGDDADWQDTISTAPSPGDYIWSRTTVTYQSGVPVKTYSVSRVGKDGDKQYGADAFLHLAYADSITLKTDGTCASYSRLSPTALSTSRWLGFCTNNREDDDVYENLSAYQWVKIAGDNAVQYILSVQPDVMNADSNGTVTTHELEFNIYKVVGGTTTLLDSTPAGMAIAMDYYDNERADWYDCERFDEYTSLPCTWDPATDGDYDYVVLLKDESVVCDKRIAVVKDGAKGDTGQTGATGSTGQSIFKSSVFMRGTGPNAPTGGSYSSPVPTGWSDGVPSGTAQLYVSTRIFTSDGKSPQQDAWSTPVALTDTSDLDICYHDGEDYPTADPVNHGTQVAEDDNGWYNEATEDSVWMAVSTRKNSTWSKWSKTRIKGEDAVTYSMMVSPSSRNLDKDGNLTGSSGYTVLVYKTVGATTSLVTDFSAEGVTLTGYYQSSSATTAKSQSYNYGNASSGGIAPYYATDTAMLLRRFELTETSSGTLRATQTITYAQDGQTGQTGGKGDDAVVYEIVPSVSVIHCYYGGYPKNGEMTISCYKTVGSERSLITEEKGVSLVVKFSDGTAPSSSSLSKTVSWTYAEGVIPTCIYLANSSGKLDEIYIPTVDDGQPGNKGALGAVLRGPQLWDDLAEGFSFENGSEGCTWKDVVVMNGIYYECVKGHEKTSSNGPTGTETDNEWWRYSSVMSFVATNILFAKNAKVEIGQGRAFFLVNSDDNVCGGLQGATVDDEGNVDTTFYPFWLGAANPENANFAVDQDGNATMRNAHLDGYLYSRFVDVTSDDAKAVPGGWGYKLTSVLNVIATSEYVELPDASAEYEGARVVIYNADWGLNGNTKATQVHSSGHTIYGADLYGQVNVGSNSGNVFAGSRTLRFYGGVVEFLCAPDSDGDYIWVLANNGSMWMKWWSVGDEYEFVVSKKINFGS